MPLPYPDNLTPLGGLVVHLSINEYWWSVLFGTLDRIADRQYWDITDEEWETEVLPAIVELMSVQDSCDPICNITYDPVSGILSYTGGGGAGSTEILNINDLNLTNNYFVTPHDDANADDVYCYAAWLIARKYADDLQDLFEIVDIVEELTTGALNNIFNSVIDLVPVLGDIAEALGEIVEDFTEELYDWFKFNIKDDEAVRGAAEIIYCALWESMADDDLTDFRAELISAAGAGLIEIGVELLNDYWSLDFTGVLDDIYDDANETNIKYAIIAYLLASDTIFDGLGLDRPLQAIMAQATQHAAAHDDRDCANFGCGYDWGRVFQWDAEDLEGWVSVDTVYPPGLRYQFDDVSGLVHDDFQVSSGSPWYRALGTMRITFASTTIKRIVIYYSLDLDNAGDDYHYLKLGSGDPISLPEGALTSYEWTGEVSITSIEFLLYVSSKLTQGALAGEARVAAVYVFGDGTDPFTTGQPL